MVAAKTSPDFDYFYDPNGNVTRETHTTKNVDMAYDALNRMTSWTDGSNTETTVYRGAEWHRSGTTVSGATTSYVYDSDNVCADVVSGAVSKQYITPFLDSNLAMTTGGQTYYYSSDGLGSVRTLTNSSGTIENLYKHNAWGEAYTDASTQENVEQRYGFTSRERSALADAGAPMYYRYRMYDSAVGRFGRRDPIRYDGGVNLYGYVNDRPQLFYDPYGLWKNVGGSIWEAETDGETLQQLAVIISGNVKDWVCIWPVPEWKAPDEYPAAKACDRADVSNLVARSGPSLKLRMIHGSAAWWHFGGEYVGSGAAVAEKIKQVSGEGATPIHFFQLLHHGLGSPSKVEEGVTDGIVFKVSLLQDISLKEGDMTYPIAVSRRGPHRCWFTRWSNSWFIGCRSFLLAANFAKGAIRRGAVATGARERVWFSLWPALEQSDGTWNRYSAVNHSFWEDPSWKSYNGEL